MNTDHPRPVGRWIGGEQSGGRAEDQSIEELVEAMDGDPDIRFFRAPGRVNLMGGHTDYNAGFVLPVAVDRECVVAARPRDDGRVRVESSDPPAAEGGVVDVAADGSDDPERVDPPWGRYVAGVVRALAERGRPPVGLDAALESSVPIGAGLSSSAAVEVVCAVALCDVAAWSLPAPELAVACRDGEELGTGVPCGVMDQITSLSGVAGHALLVDCRSLDVLPVPLPEDLEVLVVHSGVRRSLAGSAYAKRRRACEATAASLGLPALRDATFDQVAGDPMARHVVTENARVGAAAIALAAPDLPALGELFAASHASLRDDFEVSTAELDSLVDTLVSAGAVGARLTGAGFGGCVVSLVETERLDQVTGAVAGHEWWRCRSVDGAGILPV